MGVQSSNRDYSTATMTKEERKEYAIETSKMSKESRGNQSNQLAKSNYLDRPETREFHKIVRKKSLLCKRTCLDSVEQMEKEILEYFDLCDEYECVPIVIGLFNYLGLNKSYGYQIMNSDSEFAPSLKRAHAFIEELQEGAVMRNAINPVSFIFLAKNYFGLSDNQTITLKPEDPSSSNKADTMSALQEVIAEQDKKKLLETKSE